MVEDDLAAPILWRAAVFANSVFGVRTLAHMQTCRLTVRQFHRHLQGGSFASDSNSNFFADSPLTAYKSNPGSYFLAITVMRSATNQRVGAISASYVWPLGVASQTTLSNANPSYAAFDNITGTNPIFGFDWGLPFFLRTQRGHSL